MKKTLAAVLICSILLSACGFFGGSKGAAPERPAKEPAGENTGSTTPVYGYVVTVILPDLQEHKWRKSADCIKQSLSLMGYNSEIHFEADAAKQAELITEAIANYTDCIVIAASDSYSPEILEALELTVDSGTPVIAYDRLIMNTAQVDCFVAFDPYLSGRSCALAIEGALDLNDGRKNVDVILPASSNASSIYFYHGAMDVLWPLAEAGLINCNVVEALSSEDIDAVLTVDDGDALVAIEALERAGRGIRSEFPFITGAGCYLENMQKIKEGKQLISLLCDERVIADTIALTADLLIHKKALYITDKTTYHNGTTVVPAILETPVPIDINNYKELLIGGDYYTYKELNE